MIASSIRAALESFRERFLVPFRMGPPSPRIYIEKPTPGTAVRTPVRIKGVGCASQEGHLGAIVRDARGSQIGFTRVPVDARSGEYGGFDTKVAFDRVQPGEPGRIEIYDESPRDGQLVYLASVEVTLA